MILSIVKPTPAIDLVYLHTKNRKVVDLAAKVTFTDATMAQTAVSQLNGAKMEDKTLQVQADLGRGRVHPIPPSSKDRIAFRVTKFFRHDVQFLERREKRKEKKEQRVKEKESDNQEGQEGAQTKDEDKSDEQETKAKQEKPDAESQSQAEKKDTRLWWGKTPLAFVPTHQFPAGLPLAEQLKAEGHTKWVVSRRKQTKRRFREGFYKKGRVPKRQKTILW